MGPLSAAIFPRAFAGYVNWAMCACLRCRVGGRKTRNFEGKLHSALRLLRIVSVSKRLAAGYISFRIRYRIRIIVVVEVRTRN